MDAISTVTRKVLDRLVFDISGSCVGCLLEISEDHTCTLNSQNIISHFDDCYNASSSSSNEHLRLRVLVDILRDLESEARVKRHIRRYIRFHPHIKSNLENYFPLWMNF